MGQRKAEILSPASVEIGRGYWVHSREDFTARRFGRTPEPGMIRLNRGWNLVGVVQDGAIPAIDRIDSVYAWDAEKQQTVKLQDALKAGRGYWIKAADPVVFPLQ